MEAQAGRDLVPPPCCSRVIPEHTAQDHIPLPWHRTHCAGKAPAGTGGQARVWVPLAGAPAGFYPHLRVGLWLDHGCRPRPSSAGEPRAPPRPCPPFPGRTTAPQPHTHRRCGRGGPSSTAPRPGRAGAARRRLPALPHGCRGLRGGSRALTPPAGPCPADRPLRRCKTPRSQAAVVRGYWNSSCPCSEPKQIQPLPSPNPPQPKITIAVHPQTSRMFIWSSLGFTELACARSLRYPSANQSTHRTLIPNLKQCWFGFVVLGFF